MPRSSQRQFAPLMFRPAAGRRWACGKGNHASSRRMNGPGAFLNAPLSRDTTSISSRVSLVDEDALSTIGMKRPPPFVIPPDGGSPAFCAVAMNVYGVRAGTNEDLRAERSGRAGVVGRSRARDRAARCAPTLWWCQRCEGAALVPTPKLTRERQLGHRPAHLMARRRVSLSHTPAHAHCATALRVQSGCPTLPPSP